METIDIFTSNTWPETRLHFGYFRDEPLEAPAFVVSNEPTKGGKFFPAGDSLMAALLNYSEEYKESDELARVVTALKEAAKRKGHSLKKTAKFNARKKKVVVVGLSKL